MDDKEELVTLEFNMAFESVQKELKEKREQLAEQLGAKGMLHSGSHVVGIIKLELDSLGKLLDSFLMALQKAYYPNSSAWTDDDLKFLQGRIAGLFDTRLKASQSSLERYFEQRRLPSRIEDFIQEAQSVYSQIARRIQILVLKNRISNPQLPDIDIEELLKKEEGQRLEFKSTFQWDIRTEIKKEELRLGVIHTISAFSNTDGGYLFVGVQNDKSIFGLENDYSLLKDKKNWDGFCLMLTQEIDNRFFKGFAAKLKITQHTIENHDICLMKTSVGDDAVWVKENNGEVFYIRIQNSNRALSARESAEYIRKKWRPR